MSQQSLSQRSEAALQANQSDAEMWRWFCHMHEEERIRWFLSAGVWYVTIDGRQLAAQPDFDAAIRAARSRALATARRKLRARSINAKPSEVLITVGFGRVRKSC